MLLSLDYSLLAIGLLELVSASDASSVARLDSSESATFEKLHDIELTVSI